ncbi:hypothetical protein VNO77_14477 [Canavalia gladiata]|uniref:Uncharacterized protein n=1 Tax=Canavalia gladiata TaxID=3824 RepID=A0AAN9QQT1_CANGL
MLKEIKALLPYGDPLKIKFSILAPVGIRGSASQASIKLPSLYTSILRNVVRSNLEVQWIPASIERTSARSSLHFLQCSISVPHIYAILAPHIVTQDHKSNLGKLLDPTVHEPGLAGHDPKQCQSSAPLWPDFQTMVQQVNISE